MSFDINQYVFHKDDTVFGGGINFTAMYDKNAYMKVTARDDRTALLGDNIRFTASCDAPDAEYFWFNSAGDTIGVGDELNVTASATQKYFLAGRSKLANAVGYDSVSLTVRAGSITAISPNPASGQTVVGYHLLENVSDASIAVVNTTGHVVYASVLDKARTSHVVDLQNVPTGLYTVRLESHNALVDSRTLVVY